MDQCKAETGREETKGRCGGSGGLHVFGVGGGVVGGKAEENEEAAADGCRFSAPDDARLTYALNNRAHG